MLPDALILSALETKSEETGYLAARLGEYRIATRILDLSLGSGGAVWSGERKHAAICRVAETAGRVLEDGFDPSRQIAIGLGGGTGSEIILRAFQYLPMASSKILVTPLPFDPRVPLAANSVIVVPTLVDICGLNPMLRRVLDRSAALVAGLCQVKPAVHERSPTVAVSSLGATGHATEHLLIRMRQRNIEATVFHANGYGGAALVQMIEQEPPAAMVDLTTHELTRMVIDGPHAPMPRRFSAAGQAGIPQVVLPGGLNFLGFDTIGTVSGRYRERPHYRHSGFFTHVQLSCQEMNLVATTLCEYMNAAGEPTALIVPMGGFSHQDCPGGEIFSPDLRDVFLRTVNRQLSGRTVLHVTDAHISDPQVAEKIMECLTAIPALKYERREFRDARTT